MLLCFPHRYRSDDEDYAPIDYSYVGSVAEGKRRQQGANIHQTPEQASVRHRAAPKQDDSNAENTADAGQPRGLEAARRLPRSGDGAANAARIAYPRARDNDFAAAPAYAPQRPPTLDAAAQASQRQPEDPAGTRTPANTFAPQGAPPFEEAYPAHETPAEEIPEWLRMARHNTPYQGAIRTRQDAHPATKPQVSDAPPQTDLLGRPIARPKPPVQPHPTPANAEEYAQAGYPETLIALHQQEEDARQTALGLGRKRHGAQLAAPPERRQPFAPQDGGHRQPMHHPRDSFGADTPRGRRSTAPDFAPQIAGGYDPYAPQAYDEIADASLAHNGADAYAPRFHDPESRNAGQARRMPRTRSQQAHGHLPYTQGAMPEYPPEGVPGDSPPPRRVRSHPYGGEDAAQHHGYAPGLPQPQTAGNGRNPYYALDGVPHSPEDAWQDEFPQEDEAEKPKITIPYLGIATFAAALALVVLWILQGSFVRQTQAVYTARVAAQVKQADNHPYQYRELIESQAAANNLHPAFVAAIVLNESSFNPNAESRVGARGLMQMMPDTAQWVYDKIGDTGEYSFDMMYDPDTNVRYACWYLSFLSDRFRNDPVLVAAAFHAGQTTVQNWLNDSRYSKDSQTIDLDDMMDGPTKNYATRVTSAYAVYRRLYYEGGLEQIQEAQSQATAALAQDDTLAS